MATPVLRPARAASRSPAILTDVGRVRSLHSAFCGQQLEGVQAAEIDGSPCSASTSATWVSLRHRQVAVFAQGHDVLRRLMPLRAKLKAEGFLSRDARAKERKKYGQKGARKRFQFSKR